MDVVNRPLPRDFMLTKKKESPVLWIARNCMATSGRQKYVRELMKHVTVHSYGSCENNQDFPDDKNRLELMSEYKFYLAIENANCDNYVTEKLFDTFMVSAVPIVDGPVSYDGYLPTNRSVIYMDAYPDPRDLADYIRYLDNNDTAYLEYLSFRRDAVTIAAKDRLEPTFIAQWGDTYEHTQRSDYCSICRGVLPWWQARHSPDTAPYQDTHVTFLVDDSCQPEGKWNYLSTQPYQPQWIPRPRDEFTRPQIEPPLPDTEPLPSIEIADRANHNMARVSNISFACLLFLFIIFLLKRSRSTLE
ncbi:hypothetical protein BY458DRAFT_533498 [Sporodiniella umbellata]|nr:hypothetical protein BY458DRAFT_533498 [Sporodiniella umbellata]